MEMKETFLKNLKDMINDKGMSFRAFSLDIGIHRRTMSRWFFDRSPSPESVVKIANYFNCSIDYLLDRSDTPNFIPSKTPATFYERYSLLKEQNSFSDYKIAKLCGIIPSAISNWKHGTIPSFEIMVCLCDIFCCSFDYLIGRSEF